MNAKPPTPRQRRHAAKLRQIVRAASDMIVEGGFHALSMSKLANAVDFTPGALYRYFPGKDALIAAVLAEMVDGFADVLGRVAALFPEDALLERICALHQAYRQLFASHPNRVGLLALVLAEPRHLISSEDQAAQASGAMFKAMAPLAQALGRAAAQGLLDFAPLRPEQAAVVGFASTHGVLQLHKQARWLPEILDIPLLARSTTRTRLLGWGAPAAAVDAALDEVAARGDLVSAAGGLE